MRKKDVINFAPTAENRKKRTPKYVTLTVILCVVAFAVSVFVILAMNDFDPGKALGAREAETTAPADEIATVSDVDITDNTEILSQDSVNFLFLCSSDTELTFCQLISVDPASRKVKIKPLALDYVLKAGDSSGPLSEVFLKSSYAKITEAFVEKGVDISKYVHVTEDNFKRLIGILGGVSVNVGSDCEIHIDAVKYNFTAGQQNMTADMFFRYMKHAGEGEMALRIQANATADVFRQYFTLDNFNKGEKFFSSLINLVETDITAFDYNGALDVLEAMLAGECEITVVS